jgi:hypothetical protein
MKKVRPALRKNQPRVEQEMLWAGLLKVKRCKYWPWCFGTSSLADGQCGRSAFMIGLYVMKANNHNFEKYIKENPQKRGLTELCPWSSAKGQFLLDLGRFDQLQGLKPNESRNSVVAAKAATPKS